MPPGRRKLTLNRIIIIVIIIEQSNRKKLRGLRD
jgi:hypothetical protein